MFKKRVITILILLSLLLTMFIWYGTVEPDPTLNRFPGNKEVLDDPDAYIGMKVDIGGRVMELQPLVINIRYGHHTREIEVDGVDLDDISIGDTLSVFGVLEDENRITAQNTINRPSINVFYMYAVSVVAALWVSVRLYKGWRWNGDLKGLEPVEDEGCG